MNRIIAICVLALSLTSCASVHRRSETTGITPYAGLLRVLGEPVDIRSEMSGEYDNYTRFLYLPSFSAPVCVTVRGGGTVLPGQALVRTQVIQTGRGEPMSTSWEPEYTRTIFTADSVVDTDAHMELLSRVIDLRFAPTTAVPIGFAGLDGETCVLEHAEGTNCYLFVVVWSPDCLIESDMAKRYREAFPDEPVDVDAINEFLRRTVNVLNWFAVHTTIKQFDHFKFKEESFQQDEPTVPSEAAPEAASDVR